MRKLGIPKTVTKLQWKFIVNEMDRRKDSEKDTVVLVRDQKMEKEIIHKRSRRHFESTLQRHNRRELPRPTLL